MVGNVVVTRCGRGRQPTPMPWRSDRRDRPEAMPVRLAAIAVAFAIALSSCSDDGPVGAATQRNAVAAYVALDADRGVADDLSHALTRARDNEPSSPAGSIQGLRSWSRVRDETGITGTRLIFQANATEADRALLAAHARELGLGEPIWLGRADLWPDCDDEPDCDKVGDSESLP